MNPLLLLFMIVVANLVIYYVFFGKKRFEDKWQMAQNDELPGMKR